MGVICGESPDRYGVFRLTHASQRKHSAICAAVEQGVDSPMRNSVTGSRRLMNRQTGILTQNAPKMP